MPLFLSVTVSWTSSSPTGFGSRLSITTSATCAPVGPAAVPRLSLPPGPLPTTSLPGRGGSQHKYLQELIRRWADANGWRATIEQQILDGLGSVDVALERGEQRIACEVSVSSTTDYEVANIRKCQAAGYTTVLTVVVDRVARRRLAAAIVDGLRADEAHIVRLLSPEELFIYLNGLSSDTRTTDSRTLGYRVRTTRAPRAVSSAARGATITKTVVDALKRIRRRGDNHS